MGNVYEDAVRDANALREVALRRSVDAIAASLQPRLERMINEQLLNEEGHAPLHANDDDDQDMLLDLVGDDGHAELGSDAEQPGGITLPDDEGKVTLDLDDLVVPDEREHGADERAEDRALEHAGEEGDEVHLSREGLELLALLRGAGGDVGSLAERIDRLMNRSRHLIEAKTVDKQKIAKTLRDVKHTYFRVRESKQLDEERKKKFCVTLEGLHEELRVASRRKPEALGVRITAPASVIEGCDADKEQQGTNEMRNEGDYMDEDMVELDLAEDDDDDKGEGEGSGELEITVTGLPPDVDAGDLDVSVEPADDDDEGGEDHDMDLGGLDLGGDEGPGDEGGDELSDDDVVEIDEAVLRREIRRMRNRRARLHEEGPGGAPGPSEFDDFGDAKEEAEVFVDYDDGDLNKLESARRRRVMERIRRRRARASRLSERHDSRSSELRFRRQRRRYVNEIRQLRAALVEAKLFNAKILHANKLLQTEGLRDKQKAQIVESIDGARTIREVKLLNRSIAKQLAPKPLKEGKKEQRKVIGSASRPTRSGAAKLVTEAKDGDDDQVSRWGMLAGISEK